MEKRYKNKQLYLFICLTMRTRYKPPLNKKYFHKKRRVGKNDLNFLKNKIERINKKKIKQEIDEKEKRKIWLR